MTRPISTTSPRAKPGGVDNPTTVGADETPSRGDVIADGLPDMANLSLGNSNTTYQRQSAPPHVVVHAHNSPVNIYIGTDSREGESACLTTGMLRGGSNEQPMLPLAGTGPAAPPSLVSVINPEDEYIAPDDALHTGKWYAVTAGLRVGVWQKWLDMADYVTSVKKNMHKSFHSRTEALKWYYKAKKEGKVAVRVS